MALAEPPADFEWQDENGKALQEGIVMTEGHKSTLMVSESTELYYIFILFLHKSTFVYFTWQLPITHDDLFGKYQCVAFNKMGRISRQVKLTEGAKPGIPKLQVKKIDHHSVEFLILVRIIIKDGHYKMTK